MVSKTIKTILEGDCNSGDRVSSALVGCIGSRATTSVFGKIGERSLVSGA